ncbi:MAG: TraR/DksA family transcriptional regulator [Nitrospirota bacterium]
MDPKRKSNLMAILHHKKDELLSNSKREMTKFINVDCRQSYGSGTEDGDVSASLQIEDVSISTMKVRNRMLRQIDNSLQRLKEDRYGICEECGEDIDEKRLNVMPFALLCIDCQENREMMERIR